MPTSDIPPAPEQRAHEVAAILAAGLLRLFAHPRFAVAAAPPQVAPAVAPPVSQGGSARIPVDAPCLRRESAD